MITEGGGIENRFVSLDVSVFCALQKFDFAHFKNFIANLDFCDFQSKIQTFKARTNF